VQEVSRKARSTLSPELLHRSDLSSIPHRKL
jgi:hypothetical protein